MERTVEYFYPSPRFSEFSFRDIAGSDLFPIIFGEVEIGQVLSKLKTKGSYRFFFLFLICFDAVSHTGWQSHALLIK